VSGKGTSVTVIRDSGGHGSAPIGFPAVAGRVSVVIPAYNCASTVGAAVDSCLAQDHRDLEVVVVNDGSTDETGDILAAFGDQITVVTQRNGGLAAARNAGQRIASGEFVAWMDADDLMAPGRIRLQAEVLSAHPSIGLVSSDFTAFMTPEADLEASHIASYYAAVPRRGGMANLYPDVLAAAGEGDGWVAVRAGHVYDELVWGNFVHPPTVMVRRALLEASGDSDETLRYSSDYDLIVRMSRRTRFAYVDSPLLRYRRSDGQMSRVHAGERMQLEGIRILEKLREDDPAGYARMNPVIRRRMAESHICAAAEIGAADRLRAVGLLSRGLRWKVLAGPATLALGRIVTTPAMVQSLKFALRAIGFRWAMLGWILLSPDSLDVSSLGIEVL